jgi:hypothetical protein
MIALDMIALDMIALDMIAQDMIAQDNERPNRIVCHGKFGHII